MRAKDWKQHHANIAVAINRIYGIYAQPAERWVIRLVAESVADTLGRNPAFDRDRFLDIALYNHPLKEESA